MPHFLVAFFLRIWKPESGWWNAAKNISHAWRDQVFQHDWVLTSILEIALKGMYAHWIMHDRFFRDWLIQPPQFLLDFFCMSGAIVGACTGPAMAVFLCPLLAVMGGALGDLLVASKAPVYALATWLDWRNCGDLSLCREEKWEGGSQKEGPEIEYGNRWFIFLTFNSVFFCWFL